MMLKKISSLLCTLLIIASFAVTCSAQPASGTRITDDDTSPSAISATKTASGDKQTYTVQVAGNDAIGTKEQTYMTFVVTDHAGNEDELQLRISKKESGEGVIIVANKKERVYNEDYPYIVSSIVKQKPDEIGFEIDIIKNNTLIINKITCIDDVRSISDVEVVWGNENKTEPITSSADADPSTAPADTKPEANEPAEKTEDKDTEENDNSSVVKYVIIAVVAVVLVAGACGVGFIVVRKNKTDNGHGNGPATGSKSHKKQKEKGTTKNERKTSENDVISINNIEPPVVQKISDLSRISVGFAEPIRYKVTVEYDKNSGLTGETAVSAQVSAPPVISHQSIIDVFLGNADRSTLPATILPLSLMNGYELNVSDDVSPYFKVSGDLDTAKYVVVDDNKLYINPIKYYGNGFKAISSINCLDKCFTIMSGHNEVMPQGQKIISIEPATLEKSADDYILVKKGLLNVE